MWFYIASDNAAKAREAKNIIEALDHDVSSTWHNQDMKRTAEFTPEERAEIASNDVQDIQLSGAMILLASDDKVAGGKFFEAGLAFGLGKPVVIVGRRENMLLWHPGIEAFDTVEDAVMSFK